MKGRPPSPAASGSRTRRRLRRVLHRAAVLVVIASAVVPACGGNDADEPRAASAEVAVCDELVRRQNELVDVANEALAALGDAADDDGRAAALEDGFDRLIVVAERHVTEGAVADPALDDALAAGARAAVAELRDERDRFAAEVTSVSMEDEHGRAGQFQTALEKAFSHMELPRAHYEAAGLAAATDDDPDCRFVTQRADPAG